MDKICKAPSGLARRTLLDASRQPDAQSVTELTQMQDLSRFGVTKHVDALEEAALTAPRKVDRAAVFRTGRTCVTYDVGKRSTGAVLQGYPFASWHTLRAEWR